MTLSVFVESIQQHQQLSAQGAALSATSPTGEGIGEQTVDLIRVRRFRARCPEWVVSGRELTFADVARACNINDFRAFERAPVA